MTENQLRLPRDVAGGRRMFRCASPSPARHEEFQRVADDMLRLEAPGYVEGCESQNETRTGRRYVGRVRVRGGLTEAGREKAMKRSGPTRRRVAGC